jgi:hypothetical protein
MSSEIEVSLETICRYFGSHWLQLGISILLGTVFGIVAISIIEPSFEVTAVLAEKNNRLDKSDSPASRAGSIGVFASVLSGAPNQSDDLKRFIYLVRSYQVANSIRGDDELISRLFPHRWDQEKNAWRFNKSGLVGRAVKFALRTPSPTSAKPSTWEIQRYLSREVTLISLEKQGFWIIKYRHKDREVAARLIKVITGSADQYIRTKEASQLSSRAIYIEEKLQTTTQSEHRTALFSMLGSIEQRMMLLASDQTFAFDFIEPPYVPDIFERRSVSLFILAGLILGTLFGFAWIAAKPFNRIRL